MDLEAHGLLAHSPPRDPGGPGTIARVLDDALAEAPGGVALVGRHGRLTVRELDIAACRAGHALRALGVAAGDRVAVSLPNDVDIVIAFLAAMRIGAIWVGLNRALAGPEKANMLRDSQASLFLGDGEMVRQVEDEHAGLPDLREVVVVDPSDATTGWRSLLTQA